MAASLLGGPWVAAILWRLFFCGKGFHRLLREVDGIGRKALALELGELERRGLVEKRMHKIKPLRVEYVLTPMGESLKPVVGAMYEWGLFAMRQLRSG